MSSFSSVNDRPDKRYKFAKLQVVVADSDIGSARLVKQILMSFGFRRIDIFTSGEEALQFLSGNRTDLLVTEWALEGIDGLDLVSNVRAVKSHKFIRFDMPILMLTGRSARRHVEAARDAGITEFVAKPFSAKTISTRLIEIIDRPRIFVEAPNYKGPSRRRRSKPPPGMAERRAPRDPQGKKLPPNVIITRPNSSIKYMVDGLNASDIITPDVVHEAQMEIMKVEGEFVDWVRNDIVRLEDAYTALADNPSNAEKRTHFIECCYTIKSQSGVFGYELGTVVADLLINYLDEHERLHEKQFIVIRKHLDTMVVIFMQKVKEADSELGLALIGSLSKLVAKFA